jgi:phage protein, HK97 gp10 family
VGFTTSLAPALRQQFPQVRAQKLEIRKEMGMARGSTVIGLVKLQKKLDRLPKVAKDMIRDAMESAANEIVAMMKSLVPVLQEPDKRRVSGALRDSIGWTWGQAPKGSFAVATMKGAGVGGDLSITIYAGSRDKGRGAADAFYARWVEFGTRNMAAQPFFFVSWRANKKGVRRKVRAAVRKSAQTVAKGG